MRKALLIAAAAVIVAIVVIVLWPASDPLQGVGTVAVRIGSEPADPPIDFESELRVVLGDRDITIVSDERSADAVLELTDFVVNLGDIEVSLRNGALRGKARALCTLTDARSGARHVLDFVITLENGSVRAKLIPRKFWQFWKGRPSR